MGLMDNEDRFFLAFMSVAIIVLGMMFGAVLFIGLWAAIDAMTMKAFFIWAGIISFVAWASRKVYLSALKNDLMDKF